MEVDIIYSDNKDREFFDLIGSKFPIFVNYISNRNEAYKIKSYWGAKKDPFIILKNKDKIEKIFYSDVKGDNALIQLINYLNDCKI